MPIYNISYDLNRPGQDYSSLINEIKKTSWANPLKSMWLINTAESIDQVDSRIRAHLDANDRLLISPIRNRSDVKGWLIQEIWDWINRNIPN